MTMTMTMTWLIRLILYALYCTVDGQVGLRSVYGRVKYILYSAYNILSLVPLCSSSVSPSVSLCD